jgi:hypothetical protein
VGSLQAVPAAVVEVGMTAVVSEEMHCVYADLRREVVELQVLVGIVQGWVVVWERVEAVYLRQCEEEVVLVQVRGWVWPEERVKQREVWGVRR